MSRDGQEQRDRSSSSFENPLTFGVELIAKERRRQQAEEGWTPEHDAEHSASELALAAVCYALPISYRNLRVEGTSGPFNEFGWQLWPWDRSWWKPTTDDRIRELAKAGALIAAEIDRLKLSEAGRALANADAIREPRR